MTGIPNSCESCPAFLTADKAGIKFKKGFGAPMCSRYGKVLGRPGLSDMQQSKLLLAVGSKCPSHGQPPPGMPESEVPQVAFPTATLMDPTDPAIQPTSCASCAKFVPDTVVSEQLGWITGMCGAKGFLIPGHRMTSVASNCDIGELGTNLTSTDHVVLLPEYEDAFNLSSDPIKEYFRSKFVDPTVYPSDAPVSTEDTANGIRAWRKLEDAESGNFVMLPIYRRDFFTEEAQAKIPNSNDDEHPESYIDHNHAVYKIAVLWTELDETPALWGEAGVGKTELYRHMAWLMQMPFERISITASTELDDLAGKMKYTPEEGTYFMYGRLPRAWKSPCVICIDEPNTGQPDVWQFIRPLTDNSKQLVVDQNAGERVERHNDCYMGMAMNPAWDPKNVGAEMIGDADQSRLIHISMELPPPVLEREIIRKRCELDGWKIDDKRLDTIMDIAVELRGLCEQDVLPITWGIRPQIKVARASRWFDLMTAYRLSAADALEPQARDALLDMVRAHVQ